MKHTDEIKENYGAIQDGWVAGSSGQFYFGIQMSKSIKKKMEVSMRLGATDAQGKDRNALLPYYAQLGIMYKFIEKK